MDFLDALAHLKLHQTTDFMHMGGHEAVLGSKRHHTQTALLPSELGLGLTSSLSRIIVFLLYLRKSYMIN